MGASPISASLGAMGSLPRKLEELLATKHRTLRGLVMDEIEQLTADLRVLHSFMLKLSNAQDPPTSARYWMKDVRELSYDMEDFADQFVQAHGRAKIYFLKRRHHAHGRAKIRRATCRKLFSRLKISRLPERRKWRPWITNMVSEFRSRVQDATRRYPRYKLDDCVSNPGYSLIGHELPTILQDPDDLVGIEGPMNELEQWLINNGEEQLKVVSIVGVGGIGKTTLAQKLWGKLHVQFECGAFVRTAQKPDMRGILRNILLQVRPHQPPNAGEMRHLIKDIREYLQGKRYLIIIDDLWSTSVWDIVSRVFPQSDCCSRIITTTEIMEVALACCCFFPEHIFKMESLGDNDSQLLLQRILVSGNQSPQQFHDVIPQIVRSCGGLPLAIIIVARILASQPEKLKQWGSAHNSFDSIFGVNPTMEQILNICFISLPHYLKTCLLYLSTYPEGYLFLKDDLVKQWVTEGFICVNEGENMEEVARRYFDELVSMGLIQVMDINCNYEMFSYSVHQLVLDLIKYKSIGENFITVLDYSQTTIPLNDKVRRLALHFGSATYATTPTSSRLSQVRSIFFSGLFNCMPSFVVFKLLRVLILHVWDDTGTTELNLTGICELLQLRYLQVTCNVIVKLPDRIAAMKHLETLEINTRECDVPPDIVRLSSLLHLGIQGANLPSRIGGIRSLRTLMYFDLGNSSEDSLRGLGELINLQDLHLTYSSSPSSEHLKRNLIALAASVGKLCNLKYLTLAPGGTAAARVILFDGSGDMSVPMFLERLELLSPICILSRLPKWIGQLRKIRIVKVAVSELPTTDIAILTGLPSLTVLWLSVQTAPEGRTVFNNYAFPVLKYFKFSCGVLCMSFMAGAMPDLRRLKLVFNTHTGEAYDNMLAGIEHLLKLQDIAVQIGVTTGSDWRATESAINEAIDKHPRSPGRNFQCVDPVAEEFHPSGKHHWSNEKSSLDENPQDTVVQIGATTGSDWRTAESGINEAIDKHPKFPRRNFECVDPAAEEFRPSKKHQKSSLDEQLQDTVVQIGATTGSDWRAAESAINEDIDEHPRFPRRNLQCVDPVVEEFRPSKKHHSSNEESSLDEKLGVLEKSNDMKKPADSGPSQLLNLPSTVTSGRQESGSSVEESKESPAPSLQVQEEKRTDRSVSFSTVIREAMGMKQVQNVFGVLEPLFRIVVQDEIQAGLVRSPRYIERSSPETPVEPSAWRLAFLCPPALPIFTGSKIEDVNGEPLQVILVDADTGSPCGALPQYMRVELVPLFGDFPPDGREDWTAGEFARGVVKERAGKRPLLTGDVGLTMRNGRAVVNELQFTDNSSWVRCRKFRIGARVVPGSYEGGRVAEAMTQAFNVRDHRGELYRKHYPPALIDDVWRLEKIGKEGAFHRKLRQHGVETVQEFLQMLMVKPDVLRAVMGDGMTDRMWEVTTNHAKTCDPGDKVYAYAGQHGATVYVNSICQLLKIEFAGVECAAQQLSRDQKAYVLQLYMEVFEHRENLQEAEPATMLLHDAATSSSSSSSCLTVLHNTSPVAPPPLPAVQEEIQTELVRSPPYMYIGRSSLETPPAAERPVWRLAFLNPPMLPIFTGSKIEDVNGEPLQLILVDADTGSPCGALPQFMRVELVPLLGDFPSDGRKEWTAGEFARGVVKERAGKRPLLTGDVGLTMRDGCAVVNELQFTDNSSWVRCRKFRIGARVVPGSYEGGRVAEAMTQAFNVRDHRGELYRKHYPPALIDDVWRLEKIGKEGAFHRKLRQHGVETVQEFLQMLMVKPDVLRAVMGDGMTDRMWEVTTNHAKTCDPGDKVYAYAGQHGATVYVNSICQLVKIEFAGVECAAQQLSRDQKAYVLQLYVEAFEHRENLQEAEPATMLLHDAATTSSSSSSCLTVLHNTAPVAPPPHPAIPIWFQGNPELDFQIVPGRTHGNPIEEDASAVRINNDETMFGSD